MQTGLTSAGVWKSSHTGTLKNAKPQGVGWGTPGESGWQGEEATHSPRGAGTTAITARHTCILGSPGQGRGPRLSPLQDKENQGGEVPAPSSSSPPLTALLPPGPVKCPLGCVSDVLCMGYVFHHCSVSHFSGHRVGPGRGTRGWFRYLLFFFSLYNRGAKGLGG